MNGSEHEAILPRRRSTSRPDDSPDREMTRATAAVRGTAAGLAIRSHLPFAALREGGGADHLVEEVPGLPGDGTTLITWPPRPDNPFEGRLLAVDGDRYRFWASDAGWYEVEPRRGRIAVSPGADPLRRELRLFGIPAALCAIEAGDVSLHAAAVDVGGRAILLAGPSRYGKTTLAAAFARAGHRLLSEDTTRCRPETPAVHPGPAAVRLREDVGRRLRIPGATRAASADAGRVPLVFDDALRGSGDPVPLHAIVIVREPAPEPRMEAVRPHEAARDLLALAFRLPGPDAMTATFERIVALTKTVPAFHLHRPMTFESLDAVVSLVVAAVTAGASQAP
jgi:hypothetical protein